MIAQLTPLFVAVGIFAGGCADGLSSRGDFVGTARQIDSVDSRGKPMVIQIFHVVKAPRWTTNSGPQAGTAAGVDAVIADRSGERVKLLPVGWLDKEITLVGAIEPFDPTHLRGVGTSDVVLPLHILRVEGP